MTAVATDYVPMDKTSMQNAINSLNATSTDTILEITQNNSVCFVKLEGIGGGSGNTTDLMSFTTLSNPTTTTAVSSSVIDTYGGVVITISSSTASTVQTLNDPSVGLGKRFTVVNNDTSTTAVTVNSVVIQPQDSQSYIWDGSAWAVGGAIDAIDIDFTPSGSITAVNVQSAIAECNADSVLLLGRSGGQTVYGGTGASETLTIQGTSNATKGTINLNTSGGSLVCGTTAVGTSPIILNNLLNVATGNEVAYTLNYTTNKATSGNDTGLEINMTDTASPGTSYGINYTVGGVSKFSIDNTGNTKALRVEADTIRSSGIAYGLILDNYNHSTAGLTNVSLSSGTNSQTSGSNVSVAIKPTYNQSGTAANTDLLINRTQTAVGSGAQLLIDAQVGGASKFSVTNTGRTVLNETPGALAATPTLAFGDGDTGFYESADDAMGWSRAGTATVSMDGGGWYNSTASGRWFLSAATPSATIPIFTFFGDDNTGIGKSAADQLSLIAGGKEMMRLTEDTTSAIQIPNNVWFAGTDFAGTGVVNMLKTNASDQIELGGALSIGDTMQLAEDGGAIRVLNMNVTSSAADGTEESYSFAVDNTDILKVKASSDGAGGVDELQVLFTDGISTLPGISFISDIDTGVYRVGTDSFALVAGGVEGIRIAEDTTITTTMTGALIQTPESITATSEGVAASIATVQTHLTTNGDSDLDNVTLANGTEGQVKVFVVKAVGNAADSVKITPATMVGGTQITFAANPLGLGCTMIYTSTGWVVAGNNGGVIA